MLNHIFHISDLHIRNGDAKFCRYNEYHNVFTNLFMSIKYEIKNLKLKSNQFIIIVSGDIFHNKNIIGNHGLLLYKYFVTNLTKIGRTIIFHGNHDKNQNDGKQPSLISSTFDIKNLTILYDSQSFVIDNIGFSYISIDDTLDITRTSGRINDLPPFPIINGDVKYKIALFHGTFANVKLFNGCSVTDEHRPYPFEWISEFDYAILGDIHLRQYGSYKNTLWGYAGSLIQQNYGEDIITHGYMIWDLDNKQIKEVNVYNDHGMINVKQENNEFLLRIQGKYQHLSSFLEVNSKLVPKHLDIKLYSSVDVVELKQLFKIKNITINFTSVINNSHNSIVDYDNAIIKDHELYISKETILHYFHKHLTDEQYSMLNNIVSNNENLLFDITKYPPDLHDECHKKNKELSSVINDCMKSNDVSKDKVPYLIKKLEWQNLFCYDGYNEINFEKTFNNTFLISGNNGTGKSAIYDIIVLAIWGEITKNKQNCISKGIINFNHSRATTKIEIIQNNEIYVVERNFTSILDKNTVVKKATLTKNNVILQKDNACNECVSSLFGTLDDFLSSSMITQTIDNDILNMNYKDCMSVIDKSYNNDYIYNLYTLFKTTINKYKDLKKTIVSKQQVYETLCTNIENFDDINDIQNQLLVKQKILEELTKDNNNIALNIRDDYNEKVLSTDYSDIIENIDTIEEVSQSDYDNYNEISKYLKNNNANIEINDDLQFSLDDISSLSYSSIKSQNDEKNKPCDINFIKKEENIINEFISSTNILNLEYPDSLEENEKNLSDLKHKYDILVEEIEKEFNERPIVVDNPNIDTDKLLCYINLYYTNIENLINFCQKENRIFKDSNYNITAMYSLKTFEKNKKQITMNEKKIQQYNIDIQNINENIFKLNHVLSTMLVQTHFDKNERSLNDIKCEIDYLNINYDVENIESVIDQNTVKLVKFRNQLDNISAIENKIQECQDELVLLNTEEYQYDQNCVYCCKQPWVRRKSYLQQNVVLLNNKIQMFYENIDEDYYNLQLKTEELVAVKEKINNLESHYNYILHQEHKNQLHTEIKDYQCKKDITSRNIDKCMTKTDNLKDINKQFIIQAFNHFDSYNHITTYKKYSIWKSNYDNLYQNKIILKQKIKELTDIITYEKQIKPNKKKIEALKKEYYEWKHNTEILSLVANKEYEQLDNKLKKYNKKQEYLLKEKIIQKIKIINDIEMCNNDIYSLNQTLTHKTTIKEYFENNNIQRLLLRNSLTYIDKMLTMLDIIIAQFKNYRIDLYNNVILKNIVAKTNQYIANMCHNNTKKFKLDYLITDTKDVIHINWLVNNTNSRELNKQTVSIHQASGFQKFAISIALRMSLFPNCQCRQLFFDEGFTACDKLNLSIVPSFLKALLKIFNGIIIVSHIDIIQECVDLSTNIVSNKTDSSSIYY